MYRYVEQPISNGVLISSGAVPGQTQFRKFGYNASVGTSQTYIGGIGGTSPLRSTAAVPVRAFSSNAVDTSTGTGAQEIIVQGLDGSFVEIEETLSMNATSVTADSSQSFIRVHRSFVTQPGAYGGTNAGAITIETTGGTAFGLISSGSGQTQLTGYCVPAGKSLYIGIVSLSVSSVQAADVIWWQSPNANDVTAPFAGSQRIIQQYDGLAETPPPFLYEPPLSFPAYTDLWMTGEAGAGTASISAEYIGVLKG